MERYLQWLNPDYLNLSVFDNNSITYGRMYSTIESILKFHALLGTKILVNDVQIIDSPPLLKLFASEDFRKNFLRHHRDFLILKAFVKNRSDASKYEIGTAGLVRTQDDAWRADPIGLTEAIKNISFFILNKKGIDIPKLISDKSSIYSQMLKKYPKPEYKEQLRGILYSMDHFLNYDNEVPILQSKVKETQSLYKVLIEIIDGSAIPEEKKVNLCKTRDFIREKIQNEDDWHKQSKIFDAVERVYNENRNPEFLRIIKNNTHQMWTEAVQRTIQPESSSLGFLSNTPDIGVYLGRPTDIFLPVTLANGDYVIKNFSKRNKMAKVNWDPAKLSWTRVSEICLETSESACNFQEALENYMPDNPSSFESLVNYMEYHIDKLTKSVIRDNLPPRIPGLFWVIAGGIIVYITPPNLYDDVVNALFLTQLAAADWANWRDKNLECLVSNSFRQASWDLSSGKI